MLRLEDFAARPGETFEVSAGDGIVPLKLEKAESLQWSDLRNGDAFRLEWSGPSDAALSQGTYSIRFGEQEAEIFIVPIARAEKGMRYEAIFN